MNTALNRDLIECNGIRLKALIRAGIKRFELYKNEIDAINVFPVPDGDTGKNMHNTLLAVWQSVKTADRRSAGKVAHAAARGAFQGARGCSGIILSSLLTGFSDMVKGDDVITPRNFAKGLSMAEQEAYRRLAEPKEGTILTVAKKMAQAAEKVCENETTLIEVLKTVYEEGKNALAQTPYELPILKEMGVVDAGASGLVYFFEGMARYSLGQSIDKISPYEVSDIIPNIKTEGTIKEYCIEFIIVGNNIEADKLMKTLTEIGCSVIINRGEEGFKIHIHSADPKKVFDRTSRFGKPTYIKVDDLSYAQKEYFKKLNKQS